MFSKSKLLVLILVLLSFSLISLYLNYNYQKQIITAVLLAVIFLFLYESVIQPKNNKPSITIIEKEINELSNDNLLNSLPLPAALINQRFEIVSQNYGFTQLISQKTSTTKTLDYNLRQIINEAVLSNRSIRKEIKIAQYEYQFLSSQLQDNQSLILIFFFDITQLTESQRNQRRFIADASHELKTPITAIRGMSEILNTREVDIKTQKEFLVQIEKESLRLQNLVEDLLSISKLSHNRVILNYSSFNFADLVRDIYQTFRKDFIEKSVRFVCEFDQTMVWLDYSRMHQILSNLVRNALTYTDSGQIRIWYQQNAEYFIIKVSDTGIGMNEKQLLHIFDRFYRINESRSRDAGGSGLGLSIVKEIVSAHQGDIIVDSVAKEGTTFTILLPNTKLTNT